MVRTVHVSRVFQVDVDSQPEVVEELRRLAARGFEIFGPLDLSPCGGASPKPEKKPEPTPKPRVHEIIDRICERSELSISSVAALLSVAPETLYNWRKLVTKCPEPRLKAIEQLLSRCLALPKGSQTLRDEAEGAKRVWKIAVKPRKRCRAISAELAERIISLRKSGMKVAEVARQAKVSQNSVYKITASAR